MANGKLRHNHQALGMFLFAGCLSVCCLLPFRTLAAGLHGHVYDKKSHQPVAGATILVIGTHNTVFADFNGNYVLSNIARGPAKIGCTAVGFKPETLSVAVNDTGLLLQDIFLEELADSLPDVTVYGYQETGSEKKALQLQATATPIVDIIAQEAIERTSDISIADVSRRVNGLSVTTENSGEPGRTIIRGMDPKYNYTLVNGIKIPSPADRARYVPLSIFAADMVQRLEVYKSLTPDMEGDAIGGVVNMVLRNAPEEPELKINLQTGYNQTFFNQPYLSFGQQGIQKKSPYELYGPNYYATGSNFTKNNLSFSNTHPLPDLFANVTWGQRFLNKKLGLLISTGYQDVKTGNTNFFIPQNNSPQVGNAPGLTDFYLNQYSATVIRESLHAMADYKFSPSNTLCIYQFYAGEKDVESRNRIDTSLTQGRSEPGTGAIVISNRSRTHIQNLYSSSAVWNARLGPHFSVNVPFAYSVASGVYPDWAELSAGTGRIESPNGQINQTPLLLEPLTRLWLRNRERDVSASPHIDYRTKMGDKELTLSAGGLYRAKYRDNFYNDYTFQPAITTSQGQPFTNIYNAVWTNNNGPQDPLGDVANPNTYTAHEYIGAAYFLAKLQWKKLEGIAGLRYENTRQQFISSVNPSVTYGKEGSITYHDYLPSAQLKYGITGSSDIRASWYQSISRPALYDVTFYSLQYEDYVEAGNPFLQRARANNADVRYEWYPGGLDELLGGVFYKYITNPYEKTLLNAGDELYPLPYQGLSYTPAGELTSQVKNSANASDYGFEFAGAKYFGKIGLQAGYTYTYARINQATKYQTRQDAANTASNIITVTKHESRPLQGQSPNLANLGIIYKDTRSGFTARMSAIYTGRRIYSASGWYGLSYWQRGYWVTDASVEKKLGSRAKIFIKSSNLFNTITTVDLLKANPSYSSSIIPGQQTAGRITVMRQVDKASYFAGVQWVF